MRLRSPGWDQQTFIALNAFWLARSQASLCPCAGARPPLLCVLGHHFYHGSVSQLIREATGLMRPFMNPWFRCQFTLACFGIHFWFTSENPKDQVWLAGSENWEDKCGSGHGPRRESRHPLPVPGWQWRGDMCPLISSWQWLCSRLWARVGSWRSWPPKSPRERFRKSRHPLPTTRPCSSGFLWKWL